MKVQAGIKRTAAMVILKHQTSLLLLKRGKAPNIGRYVPVGGKVEPFERPIDTAIRETQEETGLLLHKEQLTYIGVLAESSPSPAYNWVCFIYKAEIDHIPPPACDEGVLEWVALSQIPQLPIPPTDGLIYEYMLQGRPFAFDAQFNAALEMTEMREEISGEIVFPSPR
jgi:8-oxo-dGTP diphosphatase